ncbi:hypothetical protein MPH_01369 [Macrophomina phaseolina MS6]|uniref:Uncharacterized protein n=1 Tax=Macrophomina phaseolina (strain MS6) TaxID=1126212 RepID=K2S918_MACPH|nr:hypothetical protein MPH_01369 [Macrophomina phaseolina MS6]
MVCQDRYQHNICFFSSPLIAKHIRASFAQGQRLEVLRRALASGDGTHLWQRESLVGYFDVLMLAHLPTVLACFGYFELLCVFYNSRAILSLQWPSLKLRRYPGMDRMIQRTPKIGLYGGNGPRLSCLHSVVSSLSCQEQ